VYYDVNGIRMADVQ